MIQSPVYKRFAQTLFWAMVVAMGTVLLGYLPYDDYLQGGWVFLSALVSAILTLRRRLQEDDLARYTRIAKGHFRFWIKNDPTLVQGLFASNVPPSVVEWFKQETGCDIMECENPHVIDSLSKKGDQPGQLIFRSGLVLGKILGQSQDDKQLSKTISQKFLEMTETGKEHLGEEIMPGVFYKDLQEGDYRPIGVHISHPDSKCLAIVEKYEESEGAEERKTFALGLRKEYLEELDDSQWQQVKNIVHRHFPYFKPAAGGSGPQKKLVPLFIQSSRSLSDQELSGLREKIKEMYKEIQDLIAPPTSENSEDSEDTKESSDS